MDTDYDRQNERPVRASSGKQEGQKSIGEVISQSLSKSGQESIDRTISQVSDYFKTAKTYVSENPRESALIAASAGLAAYVLLTTKPGRKVFDAGMALAGPELTKMFSGSTERGEKAQ